MFRRKAGQTSVVVGWHVPAKAGTGLASVSLAVPSLALTLTQRFNVK
jgi:hypothetical protein